jgi:hypothetical protein
MVACKTRSTIDRIHLLRVLAFRAGSLCRSKRGVNMSSTSRLACLVSLLIVSGALTNCASTKEIKSRIAGRWGPDPAIQATDTDDAMDRQMAVLQIIADRADIGTPSADGKHFVLSSDDLMRVVEAGFNVGREDCEVYMDNLFRMARERQRNDSVINAAKGHFNRWSESGNAYWRERCRVRQLPIRSSAKPHWREGTRRSSYISRFGRTEQVKHYDTRKGVQCDPELL